MLIIVKEEPAGVPNGSFPFKLVVTELDRSEPDLEKIAETEEWAQGLMSMDMDGFAIDAEGGLFLMDECGQYRYPPQGRFLMHVELGPDTFPSVDDPPFDTLGE